MLEYMLYIVIAILVVIAIVKIEPYTPEKEYARDGCRCTKGGMRKVGASWDEIDENVRNCAYGSNYIGVL